MAECLAFSRFSMDGAGDGGHRRAAQMRRVLAAYAPHVVPMAWENSGSRGWRLDDWCDRWLGDWNAWSYGLARMRAMAGPDFFDWSPARRRFVWLLRCAARHHAAALRPAGPGDLALVDDPLFVAPLIPALKRKGWPVIGLVQNLESLTRWQVTPRGQSRLLQRELQLLAACDLVITVSRDENVLLTNLGIPALFLPYYPEPEIREGLLAIRRARETRTPSQVFMLGSGGNHATLAGMAAVMRAWQQHRLGEIHGPLRVAGFGTEALRALKIPEADVTVLGALDSDALTRELTDARVCLCHQDDGAGALTRIMEWLVAGIPVVAGSHALRSYYGCQGTHEYATLDDMPDVLARAVAAPAPPVPPTPDETEVLKRVTGVTRT